jgi:ADP-ribosylglycohydrolase
MTGAISGAYHGVNSIPERWRQKLEKANYIEELAEKLWSTYISMRKTGQLGKQKTSSMD